jgi:pimeloyl-ACP methyl ester carboxylesterase
VTARRIARWTALTILALSAGGGLFFYLEPMRIARWMARRALDRSGLERATLAGPSGTLHYWRSEAASTTGPAMVLVHGMGDNAGTWARVAAPLAAKHRLLVPDLPGHGASDPPTGPLPFDLFVPGLLALLDQESPGQPVVLVGSSMGGWVSLALALEHPERVAEIWGLGSAAFYRDVAPITLTPTNRAEALAFIDAISGPGVPAPAGFFLDDYVQAIRTGATPRILAALEPDDFLEGRLGGVRAPVHLIWGEADDLLPVSYGRRIHAELPHATFDVIPACGHVPQWECAGELLRLMSP